MNEVNEVGKREFLVHGSVNQRGGLLWSFDVYDPHQLAYTKIKPIEMAGETHLLELESGDDRIIEHSEMITPMAIGVSSKAVFVYDVSSNFIYKFNNNLELVAGKESGFPKSDVRNMKIDKNGYLYLHADRFSSDGAIYIYDEDIAVQNRI